MLKMLSEQNDEKIGGYESLVAMFDSSFRNPMGIISEYYVKTRLCYLSGNNSEETVTSQGRTLSSANVATPDLHLQASGTW